MEAYEVIMELEKNSNKKTLLFGVILLILSIVLMYKAFIVVHITAYDESFYIATALRFFNGDRMIINDWHPAQTGSFILVPFWVVWRVFNGNSSEGVVLYFRLIYLFIKAVAVIYALYITKNTKYQTAAFVAGMMFYCSSPLCIDALSYNTMGLICVYILCINAVVDKKDLLTHIVNGLLITIIVFIQPYNIMVYIFYAFMILAIYTAKRVLKKNGDNKVVSSFFSVKAIFIITIVATVFAGLACAYLLICTDINSIINGIGYILSEPDHMYQGSFLHVIKARIIHDVDTFLSEYPMVSIVNIIWIVILIVGRKLKKNFSIPTLFILLISLVYIAVVEKSYPMNYMYMVFIWFSIEELLLVKKAPVTLYLLLIITFVYTCGYAMGSNMNILSSSAEMVAIAFIDVFLWEYVDVPDIKNINIGQVVLGITVVVMLIVHFFGISPSRNSIKLERGPLKGMFADMEDAEDYNRMLSDMDALKVTSDDVLVCGGTLPLAYLYTNAKVGMPELFFFKFHSDRLMDYYEANTHKYPTVLYEVPTGAEEDDRYLTMLKNYYAISIEDREVGRRIKQSN